MTTVEAPQNNSVTALLLADRLVTVGPTSSSAVFRMGVSTLGTDTFEGTISGGPTIDHGVVIEAATAGMTVGAAMMTEQGSISESATTTLTVVPVTPPVLGSGAIVFGGSGTATTSGGTFPTTGTGAVNFGGTGTITFAGGDPEVGFIPVD